MYFTVAVLIYSRHQSTYKINDVVQTTQWRTLTVHARGLIDNYAIIRLLIIDHNFFRSIRYWKTNDPDAIIVDIVPPNQPDLEPM